MTVLDLLALAIALLVLSAVMVVRIIRSLEAGEHHGSVADRDDHCRFRGPPRNYQTCVPQPKEQQ